MIVWDSKQLRELFTKHELEATACANYQIRVSHELEDPEWDAFLAKTPGGHHVQTSLWAQVKAPLGWRVARVIVTLEEQIVAGAQLLIRPLPLMGAIGYVPKGPLVTLDDPMLTKLVLDTLHQIARTHRLCYLAVQPPSNGEGLVQQLPHWRFRPSPLEMLPSATVLVDLTKDLDELLGQMKAKTRYNLRLAQRKGITVREGTEHDQHTFYELLVATGQRQQFSSYSKEYFSELWRILRPHGYIKLFLAEYEGEAVSAVLLIPFGDTVIYKRGAWSGRHGNRHPNELIHWTAMMWAKAQGYRYYDFDGIDPKDVKLITDGKANSGSLTQTVTSFKLGFAPQVTFFPAIYDYVYNPFLRWAYTTVFPKIANWPMVEKVMNAMRGTGG